MEDRLLAAVGIADMCEIASVMLAFPTPELAAALSEGIISEDLMGCFDDADVHDGVELLEAVVSEFAPRNPDDLLGSMRRGYSLLYLAPGGDVPVWPYESPFCFVADGREGEPSLFRSPRQIDVERHMREAGVLPRDVRTEPADSAWNELSFMSYLYGQVAKALHEGREDDAVEWSGRIVRFWDEHASKWLPAFMVKTVEEVPKHPYGAEYGYLAEIGSLILDVVRDDVDSRRG